MLRRALPDDAEALAGILGAAMRGAMPWLPELHTPEEDRVFLHEHVLPEKEVWIAERDGVVTGFTALGRAAATSSWSTSTSRPITSAAASEPS